MRVDVGMPELPLAHAGDWAVRAEALGFDGLVTRELAHDVFLPLVPAAERTTGLRLGTAVAIAFARNPMTVAYLAHDLQELAGGRFELGLGSQVKAHVEKRFAMPWSAPVARMREFVAALRAIWAVWEEGEPLRFRGTYYRHTLMSPAFSPPPHGRGAPPVLLAAVGEPMAELAGEVADGLVVHPFCTPRYLREALLPAAERGLDRAGPDRKAFAVVVAPFLALDDDEAEGIRRQLGFYGSTPGYRRVLELDGWGRVQDDLAALARRGAWTELADAVPDEVLAAFCSRGAGELARWRGLADRLVLTGDLDALAAARDTLSLTSG